MDTTKNHQEEAVRRPPREGGQAAGDPRQAEAPRQPRRQAEGQARPRQPQQPKREQGTKAPEAPRQAPPQKKAPQQEAAPRQRREAPQREAAPAQKQRSVQKEAAPRQRQEAPRQAKPAPQGKKPAQQKAGKAAAKPQTPAGRPKKAPRKPEKDDLSSTKRAYGKSKPKKKSTVRQMGEALAATVQENNRKRRARLEAQGKRGKRKGQAPAPAVIYTQPQAFNRDRLLVQLVTVTAVVVAFIVGLSVFFKVGDIRVSGAEVYTPYAISEASGIKMGDNLLTFSRSRAGALIKANLPYVKNVSFGIKLPDTVNIIIEEEDVVYAIKDQDEQWWLINSSGRVVDQAQRGQATNYTQILGVALDHPLRDQPAMAVEAQAVAVDPTAETGEETQEVVVGPLVTGAQKLNTALLIVKALEANDIVGSAASVNVSQPQNITLWYGTRYQVLLGDDANLEYKIACMNSVILNMQEYQSGVLDISFTIWPNQVGYTPFA